VITFVVPAHNEELWIGRCLDSIRSSMEAFVEPYEIIVVDDASTDATPQIVEGKGVRMIRVALRKISAVRNAGVRTASGELLFFVDADTQCNERAVRAAIEILRSDAVGGGCVFRFDGPTPLWGRLILRFGVAMGRLLGLTGGCFLFCRREAYDAVGGFSEDLYAGEDMAFVQALKKVGRFVIPKPMVVTSGRKLSVVGFREVVQLLLRIVIRGPNYETEKTLDILYGPRSEACKKLMRSSL
jgi:glycosyltransferase involved in cell wall biosynthesis